MRFAPPRFAGLVLTWVVLVSGLVGPVASMQDVAVVAAQKQTGKRPGRVVAGEATAQEAERSAPALVTGAIRSVPGFSANTLPRNDDDSTGAVPLGFTLNFFGTNYTSVYVNNNGNLTFDMPLSEFTPEDLTSTERVIIAAFFADVDTGNPGSGVVTYGTGTVNGRPAFGVNYFNVGYFSENIDKLNTFQIVLVGRSDVAPGAFDIELNYDQIQWETGDASGGTNGLGGFSARAGYSNGTGTPGTFFELQGSAVNGAFLDSNTSTGLTRRMLNTTQLGRYAFAVRNGQVTTGDLSLTMTDAPDPVTVGQTLTYTMTVSNVANTTATGVTLTDTLPPGVLTSSVATTQGSCGQSSGVLTCNLGNLAAGAGATVTLAIIPTSAANIGNTAQVISSETDTNPANNSATQTTSVLASVAGIGGRVFDQATLAGIADVFVTLSGSLTRVVKTDAQGNFSFTGLAAGGDYTVTPQSPYYGFAPLRQEFLGLNGAPSANVANFVTSKSTPPTPFQPPSDDFGGPVQDRNKWNLGTMSQPAGGFSPAVTVAQTNGGLVITPTISAGYNGYVSVNSFNLTNGEAGVQLVQAGAGGTETAFSVGEDADNFYRFVVRPNQAQTPTGRGEAVLHWLAADDLVLRFQVKLNGQVTEASIPYDPVAHKYLRFRHDGAQNAINFETSPNSTAWTARRTFGPLGKPLAAITCELSAGTSSPNAAPGQVMFDNLNLTTNTFQFKVAATRVAENSGQLQIVVSRSGSTARAASVGYQTSPDTAAAGSDFQAAQGALQFGPGEVEKTFSLQLADDALMEGDEAFDVLLGTPTGAGLDSPARHRVTITDNEASIDDARFFSRQHYLDFFSREPDQPGLDFWSGQITSCGANAGCIDNKRQNVSAAFFTSIEFQETGYLVYRAHKASFGNLQGVTWPVQMQDLLADMGQIGAGVVVGQGDWQAKLEQNKQAYFTSFVQAQRFVQQYPPSLTPTQFVGKLNQNSGGTLTQAENSDLVTRLASGQLTRAQVVRAVAEDRTLYDAEYRKAFVYMQYVGYLRRDPDQLGFDFWLKKLNEFNGDYVASEMIRSFIVSGEYRSRFGQ